MKQAYLITAYKDYDQLKDLAGFLTKTAYVYIHVDKKSRSITDEQIEKLNQIEGCRAARVYEINWGSFHHLEAIVFLMMQALMNEDVGYLHLITGEDFPLLDQSSLDERFLDEKKVFLSFIRPSDQPEEVLVRYRYKNIMANRNMKNKFLWSAQDMAGRMQEKMGMRRDGIGPFGASKIYKGLVYISMPREAGLYVLSFIASGSGAQFWNALKGCQVPEEFFFQTIFLNSPEWQNRIEDKELRFMDWSKGDGSSPSYLSDGDLERVLKAKDDGCCFARKFHPIQSVSLKEKILAKMSEGQTD
ncbi:MAG: hypothetical protein J5842_06580 [Lachnospiraceae bacterium]|nr:hypothetical protein [Lachnospiraceae bacterium]